MPPAVRGRLEGVRVPSGSPMEACQSGRMGLTANELSPSKATGGSNPLASAVADSSAAQLKNIAPVAQRIEHLTTDQKVGGSNPFGRARSASRAWADSLPGSA